MIKDLLGEILEAKKGKATIVINVQPEHESEEQEMKKQGMAPVLKDEKEDESEEMDSKALVNGEEDEMLLKKKKGVVPKNLAERAKMMSME